MKKPISFACIILSCFVYSHAYAQAFEKKDILMSLGIGGIDDVTLSSSDALFSPRGHYTFSPVRPQFLFKTEFAVHKYWGVGFISSIDGRTNITGINTTGRFDELNVQLGGLVNYHFYQLIADKLHNPKQMHADKIDIYTGFTIGATMGLTRTDGYSSRDFYPFMGLHLGARYYATPRLSVYGEIGIGQSYFNTGVSFKLGGPKKKPVVLQKF